MDSNSSRVGQRWRPHLRVSISSPLTFHLCSDAASNSISLRSTSKSAVGRGRPIGIRKGKSFSPAASARSAPGHLRKATSTISDGFSMRCAHEKSHADQPVATGSRAAPSMRSSGAASTCSLVRATNCDRFPPGLVVRWIVCTNGTASFAFASNGPTIRS
jgi:hypothetical protein